MSFQKIFGGRVKGWVLFGYLAVCLNLNAQSNVTVRVMAANLNGDTQSYQPFAIRIFQGLKPDIVAIQEFNYSNNTASDFRAMVDTAFGTNFVYYREPYIGSGDIPNGIISRYPIIASGSWTDTVMSSPNRGYAWAQIDLPGTNDIYVVSVHLLTSSAGNRAAEAANLKTLMQANFPSNAWIVVAGDFNTDSRTEAAITTFSGYLSNFPIPVDDLGNSDTSANRNHPHDYVLPSLLFANLETATVFPTHTYPNGLVFDSRVYSDLGDFSPVQSADSGLAQHMAVMKDFTIVGGTNVSGSAPSITTQPHDLSVVQSSNATFSVSANGTAPLACQWLFGGTNISDAVTNSYSVTNSQPTNAGNYSVIITNLYGSVTSSVAVLTIVTSPVITTNPSDQSVIQGNPANFSVSAIGIQPLSCQWRFNGTNISGATTNPYSLANAQLTNAGNYSVLVTNVAGCVTSAVAALTVTFASTGTVVTLAGWDMSGSSNYGSSPMPATTNVPILTVGGLTRGSGVTTLNTATTRAWGGNNFGAASASAAVTASQYATFTISANAGYNVSFTSMNKYDYRRSTAGPPNGVLQYKIGSGAFTDITNFSYTSTSGASLGPIDLSGIAALQNVGPSNPVTFRIVNYGAASSGGNWYIYDLSASTAPDLSVQGIINAVSAPAAPALAGFIFTTGGGFQLNLTGTTGATYIIQSSTNLANVNWISLFTNTAPFAFTDLNTALPQKFYRAVSPP